MPLLLLQLYLSCLILTCSASLHSDFSRLLFLASCWPILLRFILSDVLLCPACAFLPEAAQPLGSMSGSQAGTGHMSFVAAGGGHGLLPLGPPSLPVTPPVPDCPVITESPGRRSEDRQITLGPALSPDSVRIPSGGDRSSQP